MVVGITAAYYFWSVLADIIVFASAEDLRLSESAWLSGLLFVGKIAFVSLLHWSGRIRMKSFDLSTVLIVLSAGSLMGMLLRFLHHFLAARLLVSVVAWYGIFMAVYTYLLVVQGKTKATLRVSNNTLDA